MIITVELVRTLLRAQFPQWSELNMRATEPPGWDNCTLRLGDDLLVRLPTDAAWSGFRVWRGTCPADSCLRGRTGCVP
jgi:aminoglycoside phosphotransferase (APT) family kinase protein